ncbi:MAG: DUF3572 family protein [Sphingomonadaceae bacterium]
MANDQNAEDVVTDALVTALSALGWIVREQDRADRLLALTGLSPASLREGIEQPAVLAALLLYLEAHEPDLLACAEAIGVEPSSLVRARTLLEAQSS